MKKMMMVMVLILAMVCVVPAVSMAAAGWYTANVIQVGVGSSAAFNVKLTDTAAPATFTNQWFTLRSTVQNQQLATALTAISLGKTVYCYLGSTAAYGQVTAIYVNQ